MTSIARPPSLLGNYRPVSKEELVAAMEEDEFVAGYEAVVLFDPAEHPNLARDGGESNASSTSTSPALEQQQQQASNINIINNNNNNVDGAGGGGSTSPALRTVTVSPFIGKCLREHQREGVRFLFECVNGLRPYKGWFSSSLCFWCMRLRVREGDESGISQK